MSHPVLKYQQLSKGATGLGRHALKPETGHRLRSWHQARGKNEA